MGSGGDSAGSGSGDGGERVGGRGGVQVKEIIAAYSENPENDWNSANYPTLSALRSLTRKLPLKRCLRRERML